MRIKDSIGLTHDWLDKTDELKLTNRKHIYAK